VGEFLMEQYRHCKPILALGQSASLLDDLGIAHVDATDGDGSASVLSVKIGAHDKGVARFIKALAQHRDYARETDPPMV
jgi:catalase